MTDLDRYHHDIIDALDYVIETNRHNTSRFIRARDALTAGTARQAPDQRRVVEPASLAALAGVCVTHLREHFPADTEQTRQVLALAEEAGEFVGAYRRWAGLARRTGRWEEVTAELADVVITAYVTAHVLGIDLDTAWRTKAATVLTRGWREPTPTPTPTPTSSTTTAGTTHG